MAKIECYNCKKQTAVVAPSYRCKFCNYPLNKYVESDKQLQDEVIIENPKQIEEVKLLDAKPLVEKLERIEEKISVNDLFKKNVPEIKEDLKTILEKLKPDEKIKKSVTGAVIMKKNTNPEKSGKLIVGWLVVHTEGKLPVTYELFEGDNIIGRPDGPHHVDIRIEDDEYVSRVHAVIKVNKDFLHRFHYELIDDGKLRNGAPSTNGAYINGIIERLPKNKVVFLKDGDTIQIGMTKLVFKDTNHSNDDYSAFNSVNETDYTETVAIKK